MKKFGIILASLALFFSLSTGVTAQATSQNLSTTNAVKLQQTQATISGMHFMDLKVIYVLKNI